jgi:hypothetical protein
MALTAVTPQPREDVVDCYYRARYAGRPPLAGEVQGLARRLEDGAP